MWINPSLKIVLYLSCFLKDFYLNTRCDDEKYRIKAELLAVFFKQCAHRAAIHFLIYDNKIVLVKLRI